METYCSKVCSCGEDMDNALKAGMEAKAALNAMGAVVKTINGIPPDENGDVTVQGGSGGNGATFTPAVSQDGIISWTNDKGLENPEPVNITGPRGLPGDAPSVKVTAIDGGHQIRVIANGLITDFNVMDGTDGYNPVRGVDYWTDADKAEIRSYVDEAILGGVW